MTSLFLRRGALRLVAGFTFGLISSCGGGGGHKSLITRGSIDVTPDRQAALESLFFEEETFEADDCAFIEGSIGTVGLRRLLRFDTIIINYGELPIVLGSPADPEPPYTASQFEFSPCHGHYHFSGWADYELKDSGGTTVAFGHKQAFCLLDSLQYVAGAPEEGFDCDFQGISSGWADIYSSDLDGQWVDVTGIPEGDYTLEITVNSAGKVPEMRDEHPNTVSVPVHVPDPSSPLP